MPNYKPSYQIQRTEVFIKRFNSLLKIYPRVGELLEAIDWALCRKPHSFSQISGNYYLWVTDELSSEEIPAVKIVYIIQEEENIVVLLEIEEK